MTAPAIPNLPLPQKPVEPAPPIVPPVAPPIAPPTNPTAAAVLAAAKLDEYNRIGLNYRDPVPRPKVRGKVIDIHSHLFARRHAKPWFEAADHYGIDCFGTMTPLEEALILQKEYGDRLHFIAIPKWADTSVDWWEDWLRRLEAFYNIGSRIVKFHMAPGTMVMRKWRFDSPGIKRIRQEIVDRKMIFMSHVGDPETWYKKQYADTEKFGLREAHYKLWEEALEEHRGHPWLGAHLGGNPENPARLSSLLERFPDLVLDCSATRWMVREVSRNRDGLRDFFIRWQDRILFGSDQVSGDDRNFDFFASRFWAHRKLWETAYVGPNPILDPDLEKDKQENIRGLALPDEVLQKLYHDNAVKLLARAGVKFGE